MPFLDCTENGGPDFCAKAPLRGSPLSNVCVGSSPNPAYRPAWAGVIRGNNYGQNATIFEDGSQIPDFFGIPDYITLEIFRKIVFAILSRSRTIVNKNNTITVSPGLKADFTNVLTGETLTFGITGASHTTGNTTKATGHNLLGDLDDPAGPELVLTKGNFTYSFDEQGNPSPLTGHGQEIPLIEFLLPIL